jgi:osmotically-inducible protein OsmY
MRIGTLAAWLLAIVLVAATFAVSRVQAQDKPASSDASISEEVQRVLAKDVSLRGAEIHVQTLNGVVDLSGFVRSVEDIAKAQTLAGAVPGVSSVRNALRVANRPSRA